MKDGGQDKTIVFVGDNKGLPEIKKMAADGIVGKEKYKYLKKLYTDKYNTNLMYNLAFI